MKLRPILFKTPMVQALIAGTKTQTRRLLKPQPILTERRYMRFAEVGSLHVTQDLFPTTSERGLVFAYKESAGVIQNMGTESFIEKFCKYKVGDVLWVKETYRKYCVTDPETGELDDDHIITEYRADGGEMIAMVDGDGFQMFNKDGSERFIPWISSMYMPFALARLFLEVTAIRVERLQDISEEDSKAEGVHWYYLDDPSQTDYKNYLHKGDDDWGFVTAKGSYLSLWDSINGEGSADTNPFVWVYEFKKADKPAEV